jgi:hypothetical protein
MLDKARAHHQRKVKPAAREEIPLLDLKPLKNLLRPATDHLPQWKQHLGGAWRAGKEKLGDAYAAVAQVAALQKEAFADHLAERRNQPRTSAKGKSSPTSESQD